MASVRTSLGYLPVSRGVPGRGARVVLRIKQLDDGIQPCTLHCCYDSVLDSKGGVHVLGGMGQCFPMGKEEGLLRIKLGIHTNKK